MKIVLLDNADMKIMFIDVPDDMIEDDVYEWLVKQEFYHQGLCSYMAGPLRYWPVEHHEFGFDEETMEETHEVWKSRIK